MTPYYIGELFENQENRSTSTKNSFLKLKQPSVKTNFGKKVLFYTAPALWKFDFFFTSPYSKRAEV